MPELQPSPLNQQPAPIETESQIIKFTQAVVFRSRWLLLLFIFGLIAATLLLGVDFILDLVQLFTQPRGSDQTLTILNLFDKFMVATLLITSSLGTYRIFVRPIRTSGWMPEWLDDITAKDLKIVMSLSLAGVTGIGLLKDFHEGTDWLHLSQHLAIHFTFILSPMAIALIWKWMHPTR